MEHLNAALRYAALGYRVLPCVPNEKRPATAHGLKDATSDPTVISAWFTAWPEANVAIATDGLLVVDIDVIDGQPNDWPNDVQKRADLTVGPESVTPRGGRHYWFRQPAGATLRNTSGRLAKGVDTRADGGYVLVAPSVVNGKPYEWTRSLDVAADALPKPPEWLLEALTPVPKQSTPAAAINITQPLVGAMPGAVAAMVGKKMTDNGDGSKRLYAYACTAVEHDFSDDEAVAAICQAAESKPFPREWSDTEIIARIRSAEKAAVRGSATKPEVDVTCHDLAKPTRRVWDLIRQLNDPPKLFSFGDIPSRVELNDRCEPAIRMVGSAEMRWQLAEWLKFVVVSKDGNKVVCPPPGDVVSNVLATPEKPLPCLLQIVEAPIFGADGSLKLKPGYHRSSETLYMPKAGFRIPEVNAAPSPDDISKAAGLLQEMICDFPFVDDAEQAHAICLPLQFFARNFITGPTPLFLFEKPSPGTGGTLLVDVLTYLPIGRSIAGMTASADEDEMRKRITAQLRTSPAFILIDNLREHLDAACLASAITSTTWEDRILGASVIGRFPVRCAWIATANNPTLSLEMARRTIRIRLDAQTDRPWLRTDFMHPDLKGWVAENRGKLVWAALTLVQAWLAAGRPDGKTTLGMFESWSRVLGGILDTAGIPGFLANRHDFYAEADTEGQALRGFFAQWWEQRGSTAVGTSELYADAWNHLGEHLGTGNDRSQVIRLGKLLAGARDRVFGIDGGVSLKLMKTGTKARAAQWSLALAA